MKNLDYISADFAELADDLMRANEELLWATEERDTNQRRLDRFDRGITAYMWELERFPKPHRLEISPKDVQQMLDALLVFTETGQSIGLLDKALKELT